MMYEYRAVVTSIYDGDTITVRIDLGFGIELQTQKVRLYGIDAPEIRGATRERGLAARDFLLDLIKGEAVILQTIKDRKEKYGRWLGIVWLMGTNVSGLMIQNGHAVPNYYGKEWLP